MHEEGQICHSSNMLTFPKYLIKNNSFLAFIQAFDSIKGPAVRAVARKKLQLGQ